MWEALSTETIELLTLQSELCGFVLLLEPGRERDVLILQNPVWSIRLLSLLSPFSIITVTMLYFFYDCLYGFYILKYIYVKSIYSHCEIVRIFPTKLDFRNTHLQMDTQ